MKLCTQCKQEKPLEDYPRHWKAQDGRTSTCKKCRGFTYKHRDSRGYIRVWDSEEKRGVMEHRKVMEDHFGRRLLPSESVHHINGRRTDNRIENLQLRKKYHGSGQVHVCGACGSSDIRKVELAQ